MRRKHLPKWIVLVPVVTFVCLNVAFFRVAQAVLKDVPPVVLDQGATYIVNLFVALWFVSLLQATNCTILGFFLRPILSKREVE